MKIKLWWNVLKAFFLIKKEATKEVTVMEDNKPVVKDGWKTSEFWVTVFTVLGTMAGQVQGMIPAPWGIIVTAVITCGYQISRALVKKP